MFVNENDAERKKGGTIAIPARDEEKNQPGRLDGKKARVQEPLPKSDMFQKVGITIDGWISGDHPAHMAPR